MSIEPDWSKVPEGYSLWIEDAVGNHTPGWHRKISGGYQDKYGRVWPEEEEDRGRIIVHRRPEPVAWDGEVPPVGAEFEYSANGRTWEERVMLFNDGLSLLMANKKYPANRWHYKACDGELQFRPIPTPEQKAAQERERAIEEMASTINRAPGIKAGCAELYSLGYRKTGGES